MTAIPDDGPRPVDPVSPVAPWLSGKARLAKRLCEMINAAPHRFYAEPFVGMCGVFFRRDFQPPELQQIRERKNGADLFCVPKVKIRQKRTSASNF